MAIKIDMSGFIKGVASAELKKKRAVEAYGEMAGKKMEAYAKENRPWEDRTFNARNALFGGSRWNAFLYSS